MGTAERRKRESAERREQILAAARKVFFRDGYSGTTMPRIAREAELAAGTLYLYFKSKDALYIELLNEGYDILLQRLGGVAESSATPREAAEGLIKAFLGFVAEFPEYYDIMFFVFYRESGQGWGDKLPASQIERAAEMERACRQVVFEMISQAGLGDDIEDRQRTVHALWAMLAGVVLYFRHKSDFKQLSEKASELLLKAIFAEDPS